MEIKKEKEEEETEIELDLLDELNDDEIISNFYLGGQEAVEKEVFSDAEESDEEHPTLEGKKYFRVKSSRDVVKVMDKTLDKGEDSTIYVKYPKSEKLKTNFRLMHKTSKNPGNWLLFFAGTQESPSYEDFSKLKGEKETEKEAFTNFQSFATGEIPKAWTPEQQKLGFGLMSITSGSEYERSTFGLQSFQVESENIQSGLSTFKDSFTKGPNKSDASFLGAKKDGGSLDLRRVERGHLSQVHTSRKNRQAEAIRKNIKHNQPTKMKFKGRRQIGKKPQFSESEMKAIKKKAEELLREQGKDVLYRMKVLKK